MRPVRVGLVGVGGYGRVHLQHLLEFHRRRELQLVAAVVLPAEQAPELSLSLQAIGCEQMTSFDTLVAAQPRLQLDLCIVPTPIHLHAPMTVALLEVGVNVLVEKPIAATLPEVERIAAAARRAQRIVAVGFQYLHAPEVQALKQQILLGAIGSLQRIAVHAAWPRSHAYYQRNDWAGRLRVGDAWVCDSPVTNAMSHFLMLLLYLAAEDAASVATPVRLHAELYRAQAIESFDTAVIEMMTASGCQLAFYGTHSSREAKRPTLVLEGSAGRAEWIQDSHAAVVAGDHRWNQAAQPEPATREAMLRAVLRRLRARPAFICTPEFAAAHVRCVEALRRQVPIAAIPSAYLSEHGFDGTRYTYVPGLDDVLEKAARERTGLRSTGAPWAVTPTAAVVPL